MLEPLDETIGSLKVLHLRLHTAAQRIKEAYEILETGITGNMPACEPKPHKDEPPVIDVNTLKTKRKYTKSVKPGHLKHPKKAADYKQPASAYVPKTGVFPCPHEGCQKSYSSQKYLDNHTDRAHGNTSQPVKVKKEKGKELNGENLMFG